MKKQHILVEKPVIMVGIVAMLVSVGLYVLMSASKQFSDVVDSLTNPIKQQGDSIEIYRGRYR